MTTYLTAIPPAPEYGPHRVGRDSVAEILAEVRDISKLSGQEQSEYIRRLASRYPPIAFVDALVFLDDLNDIRGDR